MLIGKKESGYMESSKSIEYQHKVQAPVEEGGNYQQGLLSKRGIAISVLPFTESVQKSVSIISQAAPDDVPKIASEQIKVISDYYSEVLKQCKQSFNWARYVAIIGFIFFIGAVVFLLIFQLQKMATISLIAGALIEVSSGVGFYLYSKSMSQMADYFDILDATQRYLLANSICERIADSESKDKARSDLIKTISLSGPRINNAPADKQENKEEAMDPTFRTFDSRFLIFRR